MVEEDLKRCKSFGVARGRGFTLVELMVVLSIVAILMGLLLPAVQMAREAARQSQCENNIKQLSLGVVNFESVHKHLPSGGWGKRWAGLPEFGVGVAQPGGWIYQVLPFVELESLHAMGGQHSPQGNRQRLETAVAILHCPSRRGVRAVPNDRRWTPHMSSTPQYVARNDYAMNGGSRHVRYSPGPDSIEEAKRYRWADMTSNTGLCFQRSRIRLAEIRDGLSNTYLLGEKQLSRQRYTSSVDWGDNECAFSGDDRDIVRYTGLPGQDGFRPIQDGRPVPKTHDSRGGIVFGSAHTSVFYMAFADGSVHAISYGVDNLIHSSLGSRADGVPVDHTF